MSLRVKYETAPDARARLAGSVVLYDGRPVLVRDVLPHDDGVFRVQFTQLPGGDKISTRMINSPKFDADPFPMGYCNSSLVGDAVYLQRMPTRNHAKLGLTAQSLVYGIPARRLDVNFQQFIQHQDFADMLRGDYPTLAEAIRVVKAGQLPSVAFNRTFAVSTDDLGLLYLVYKQERVGFAGDDTANVFTVPKKNRHLAEVLGQSNVRHRIAA